jgi:hypothetical protein
VFPSARESVTRSSGLYVFHPGGEGADGGGRREEGEGVAGAGHRGLLIDAQERREDVDRPIVVVPGEELGRAKTQVVVIALHRLDERGDDPGIARAREPLEDADAEIGVLAPERGEEGIEAALGAQPLEQLEGVAAHLGERGVSGPGRSAGEPSRPRSASSSRAARATSARPR